jgi:hypothetical protein
MTAKYGILREDTYNFDETGFSMGLISTSKVVTGAERRGRPKAKQPGNREWVTAVHCINTEGWQIPPMIILKGKEYHQSFHILFHAELKFIKIFISYPLSHYRYISIHWLPVLTNTKPPGIKSQAYRPPGNSLLERMAGLITPLLLTGSNTSTNTQKASQGLQEAPDHGWPWQPLHGLI